MDLSLPRCSSSPNTAFGRVLTRPNAEKLESAEITVRQRIGSSHQNGGLPGIKGYL